MLGALIHRTAPPESRLQPVAATHRLKPGLPLRGRRPMTQYRSNNRAYLVPDLEEDTASGRVEETILFSQKMLHMVQHFL